MRNHLETYQYPNVHDYASALAAWTKGRKFRDYPERAKIVDTHRDKWITKQTNGDISFVRGGTEVVRWHPAGGVTVAPHNFTITWDEFANAFLPIGLTVSFSNPAHASCRPMHETGLGQVRHYRLTQATHFLKGRGRWEPTRVTEPWPTPHLDLKAANAALKARGYDAFMDWARALVALGGWQRVDGLGDEGMTTCMAMMNVETVSGREQILAALASPMRWTELLHSPPLTKYTHKADEALERVARAIRKTIHATDNVVIVGNSPYLEGDNAVRTYMAKSREYRSALLNSR